MNRREWQMALHIRNTWYGSVNICVTWLFYFDFFLWVDTKKKSHTRLFNRTKRNQNMGKYLTQWWIESRHHFLCVFRYLYDRSFRFVCLFRSFIRFSVAWSSIVLSIFSLSSFFVCFVQFNNNHIFEIHSNHK